jgi:cytoskeletal protein RodZ
MSKKSRLITCKHCGNSNSVSAKTSPHSNGKNKKSFDIKRWFWVIIVIILIGTFSGCISMDSSSTTKETTSTVASESTNSLSIKVSTPVAAEKETEPTATVEETKPEPTAAIEATKPEDNVSTEY